MYYVHHTSFIYSIKDWKIKKKIGGTCVALVQIQKATYLFGKPVEVPRVLEMTDLNMPVGVLFQRHKLGKTKNCAWKKAK